jgi:hypothetical protein
MELPSIESSVPKLYPQKGGIRLFSMYRIGDTSGVSGTGLVLLGCIFPDGRTVVQWVCPPDPGDTQVRNSFQKFLDVHVISHPDNNTIISFHDGERWLYNREHPVGLLLDN